MSLHINPGDIEAFTRRQFLISGLTLASASLAVPAFLQRSALGMPMPAAGLSSIPGVPEDHILVVVQLSGGNDGLNTVVPWLADEYYRARPGIAITREQVLRLGARAEVGLHPQMAGVKELYDAGQCAIVQGVGYPNPNRSHFKSMDIWHTADTSATGNGWLGRYFDSECCGFGAGESGRAEQGQPNASPGVAIGRTAPLAMQGRKVRPIAFESEHLFRWSGHDIHESLARPYDEINRRGDAGETEPGSNADFLMRTALDAQISSDLIRRAVRQRPLATYPRSELAQQLQMVAAMIRSGLPTRVYYVSQGGYDTHAGQGGAQGRHGQLIGQFSAAVRAFYADLKAQENDARVLTMSFSEFGRRVAQNASQGTDHGTAAPMFLFGPMVKPGLHATYPPLNDLDAGDLKYQVDFRSVYAGILEGWLKADSKKILEGSYRPLGVIAKA